MQTTKILFKNGTDLTVSGNHVTSFSPGWVSIQGSLNGGPVGQHSWPVSDIAKVEVYPNANL